MVRTSPLPVIALALALVIASTGFAVADDDHQIHYDPFDPTLDAPDSVGVNETHTVEVTVRVHDIPSSRMPDVAYPMFQLDKDGDGHTEDVKYKRINVTSNTTKTVEFTVNPSDYNLTPGKYVYYVYIQNGGSDDTHTVNVTDSHTPPSDIPGDVDDDGAVEDVDGDGEVTIRDVALFLDTFDGERDGDRFDHTGDGDVTIRDVATLLNHLP
jgi:hypothetical protein